MSAAVFRRNVSCPLTQYGEGFGVYKKQKYLVKISRKVVKQHAVVQLHSLLKGSVSEKFLFCIYTESLAVLCRRARYVLPKHRSRHKAENGFPGVGLILGLPSVMCEL